MDPRHKAARLERWAAKRDWVVRAKDPDLPFGEVSGVRWCEEHDEVVLLLRTAEGMPFVLHESEVEHTKRRMN